MKSSQNYHINEINIWVKAFALCLIKERFTKKYKKCFNKNELRVERDMNLLALLKSKSDGALYLLSRASSDFRTNELYFELYRAEWSAKQKWDQNN